MGEFDEARATEEIVHMRGPTGNVWAMALPLSEPIAEQVEKGVLVRVNEDGTPWEPADDAPKRPRTTTRKTS